jgi:3-hydroxyisobutyrate dehydrogenase-like beta-hydroxyacid dehydrogenase
VKIGFIGLGIMGSRMAANLLEHDYDLVVYNRTKAKADPLIAKGAVWGGTPAEVGQQVQLLFTMLATPEAILDVALGEGGFLDQLQPGALWVDCSTVNPTFSRQMALAAWARRVRFVDAPAAGTKGPAERGELMFLVGGRPDDVKTCQPLLEAMGRKVLHVGENGLGTGMKMVFNLLLGEAMAGFAEAMALGQSLGISQDMLLEVLPGSAVVAPFIQGKRVKIEAGEYDPEFPLKWMHKDLQLATVTGYEQDVPLPLASIAKEIYALAAGDGLADLDFSAICRFLAEKAGL